MISQINNKTRWFEIIAVLLTATGKFVFMDALNWKLPFIISSVLAWTAYIVYKNRKTPGIFNHWGFRKDNFNTVLKMVWPFGLIAIVTFFIIGWINNTINLTWHIIPVLLLYPVWGIIQQFLLMSLVAGNLQDLKNFSSFFIIAVTSILFGLLHYPDWWLVAGTFVLAIFYSIVFLKERNIFVLGIFHGWLGALFYYSVVNTDPFLDVFGKLNF